MRCHHLILECKITFSVNKTNKHLLAWLLDTLTIRSSVRKKSQYSELFWSTFFLDFPAFGLNTEKCGVSLRIQFEYGKMREKCSRENAGKITLHTDSFYTVRRSEGSGRIVSHFGQNKSFFIAVPGQFALTVYAVYPKLKLITSVISLQFFW